MTRKEFAELVEAVEKAVKPFGFIDSNAYDGDRLRISMETRSGSGDRKKEVLWLRRAE